MVRLAIASALVSGLLVSIAAPSPAQAPASNPVPAQPAAGADGQGTTGQNSTPAPISPQGQNSSGQTPGTANGTAAPNPTPPPPRRTRVPWIGIDYSLLVPSSAKTRQRFGQYLSGIGIGIGSIYQPNLKGSFGLDIGIQAEEGTGAYMIMVPVGVRYVRALAVVRSWRPFVGATVDMTNVLLRSEPDNIGAAYHVGYGGSLFLGTSIARSGHLQIGYALYSSIRGFDFSGPNLDAGVRF